MTPRAIRFPIKVPLHYRPAGPGEWSSGRSVCISRSGVLFRGERALPVQTPCEIDFQLPLLIRGRKAARVRCSGTIVRSIEDDEPAVTLAASITTFELVKASVEH